VLFMIGFWIWLLLPERFVPRRVRWRNATTPASLQQQQELVAAAVEQGLSELDDDDADPRVAVLACWVRLEQAAAAAGTPRQVGDTSTDLVVRLLASHQVSVEILADFAEVYRLARFATRDVDASMRERARAALAQLRNELLVATP
jgi:hypothetical protein